MDMMGRSFKSDGSIKKNIFCVMVELFHRRREKVSELTWPTSHPHCWFMLNYNELLMVITIWYRLIGSWLWNPTWFPCPCWGTQPAWSCYFFSSSMWTPLTMPVYHWLVQIHSDTSTIADLGWRPIYNPIPGSELPCAAVSEMIQLHKEAHSLVLFSEMMALWGYILAFTPNLQWY